MKPRELVNVLLGLLMLGLGGTVIFLGLRWMVQQVSTLETQVSSSIIAGGVAILVAAMGYAFQATWNRKREVEEAQRPAKTELYKKFLDHWFKVMNIGSHSNTNTSANSLDKKIIDEQIRINKEIILWGSDDVINAYRKWWQTAKGSGLDPATHTKTISEFEDLLFEIRKDLGHKNQGLDRKDLLTLFINDIHDIDLSDFPRNHKKSSGSRSQKRSTTTNP